MTTDRRAPSARHGYTVRLEAMGEELDGVGAPSQLAVFSKAS